MEDNRIHSCSKKLYESNKLENLKQLVNLIKEKYSENTAFIVRDKTGADKEIKFKDFVNDIEALGTALTSVGLSGKKIAVISENRYEWSVTYLATATGVGIVVPLDKSLPENEFYSLVERSEVEAIFYSKKYDEVMKKLKEKENCSVKYFVSMDLETRNDDAYSFYELIDLGKNLIANGARTFLEKEINNEEMAIMLFTSGTTSKSKAVMLSHKNICSNINAISEIFDLNINDTLLSFLPLHHTFECTVGFLYPISMGSKIVYCRGLRHIAEDIKNYQITAMISVPVMFESIYRQIVRGIEKKGKIKKFNFGLKLSNLLRKVGIDKRRTIFKEVHENLGGKLRIFVAGAAAFNPEIEEKLNDIGIETYQGYGATENSPVIAAEHRGCSKPGSVGKLLPETEGKLINIDENGIGELIVKNSSVMLGYYKNDEATKETLKDGWLYTGDLGYFDKDDYLFLTGRKKNVIVLKNGKNIYPEELEALVNDLVGIKESFVYGKPDSEDKDDLKLAVKVVYDKDIMKKEFNLIDEKEIHDKLWKDIKEINKTMPTYKYIKELTVTTVEFEKTTTQKIKRFEEIKKV